MIPNFQNKNQEISMMLSPESIHIFPRIHISFTNHTWPYQFWGISVHSTRKFKHLKLLYGIELIFFIQMRLKGILRCRTVSIFDNVMTGYRAHEVYVGTDHGLQNQLDLVASSQFFPLTFSVTPITPVTLQAFISSSRRKKKRTY